MVGTLQYLFSLNYYTRIYFRQSIILVSFELGSSGVVTYINWLKTTLPPNSRVGIDPFLISASDFRYLATELQSSGHTAVPIQANIIDVAWKSRPPLKLTAIEPLDYRFSGISHQWYIYGRAYYGNNFHVL